MSHRKLGPGLELWIYVVTIFLHITRTNLKGGQHSALVVCNAALQLECFFWVLCFFFSLWGSIDPRSESTHMSFFIYIWCCDGLATCPGCPLLLPIDRWVWLRPTPSTLKGKQHVQIMDPWSNGKIKFLLIKTLYFYFIIIILPGSCQYINIPTKEYFLTRPHLELNFTTEGLSLVTNQVKKKKSNCSNNVAFFW